MPDSTPSNHDVTPPMDVQPINSAQVTASLLAKRCWVTVEPALFLTLLGNAISSAVFTQLLLVRICEVTYGFSSEKCFLLVNKTNSSDAHDLEALVQPRVTLIQMYKSLIEACVPAVLTLFIGTWSDVHGRKLLILGPQFGFGLQLAIFALLSAMPNISPMYYLLGSVPVALSGGLITIISGVYSYISDISSADKRAFRMGMLDTSIFAGFVVGPLISAPLFHVTGRYGYLSVFSVGSACCLFALLYTVFLPETVDTSQREQSDKGLSSLCDFQLVVKMFSTCCKRRENYGRTIIFIMIFILATCKLTMDGEAAAAFLYARNKFNWDLDKYTVFNSLSMLASVIGGILGMYVFSVQLKVPDSILAFALFVIRIAQQLLVGLAPNETYMYISILPGSFVVTAIGPLCRSVLSKSVSQSDIGTVFALTSGVEALTPLASSPLYSLVYNATLPTFPGAFMIMSAAVFLLIAICTGIVIVLQRISASQDRERVTLLFHLTIPTDTCR